VQTPSAQLSSFPKVVSLTSFSNHVEILCHCKTKEQRLFYMLYANKELHFGTWQQEITSSIIKDAAD
jgi:hypothetical protein